MKQTIRLDTFETNSSSYHTISLVDTTKQQYGKFIIKGEPLVLEISNDLPKLTIKYYYGHYSEYKTDYEKAVAINLLLLDKWVDEAEDYIWKEHRDKSYSERQEIIKEQIKELPLYKAFINALKRYAETDDVTVILDNYETLRDDMRDNLRVLELDGYEGKPLEDKIIEIISSPNLIISDKFKGEE